MAKVVTLPPTLLNPTEVVRNDVYPTGSLRKGESGIVSVRVIVSDLGKATACQVTETSGSVALDSISCRIVVARGRFDPAKDSAGRSVQSYFLTSFVRSTSDRPVSNKISFPLTVNQLPLDYRKPVETRVIFDEEGKASECDVQEGSRNAAADAAACEHIIKQLVITPPKAKDVSIPPAAVRYVVSALAVG